MSTSAVDRTANDDGVNAFETFTTFLLVGRPPAAWQASHSSTGRGAVEGRLLRRAGPISASLDPRQIGQTRLPRRQLTRRSALAGGAAAAVGLLAFGSYPARAGSSEAEREASKLKSEAAAKRNEAQEMLKSAEAKAVNLLAAAESQGEELISAAKEEAANLTNKYEARAEEIEGNGDRRVKKYAQVFNERRMLRDDFEDKCQRGALEMSNLKDELETTLVFEITKRAKIEAKLFELERQVYNDRQEVSRLFASVKKATNQLGDEQDKQRDLRKKADGLRNEAKLASERMVSDATKKADKIKSEAREAAMRDAQSKSDALLAEAKNLESNAASLVAQQ